MICIKFLEKKIIIGDSGAMKYGILADRLMVKSDLFGVLTADIRQKLIARSPIQKRSKRHVIFYEESHGETAYFLLDGTVKLSRETEDGREIVIGTMQAGSFFAEVVLCGEPLYPVSAVALTDSVLLAINRQEFRDLLTISLFRDRFISLLIKKQRYLTQRVRYLTLYDLEERFFRFLRSHYGTNSQIRPGISRKDLAAAIGATPESLSRLVRRLTDAGRIKWVKDLLIISDPVDQWQE